MDGSLIMGRRGGGYKTGGGGACEEGEWKKVLTILKGGTNNSFGVVFMG